MNIEIIRYFNPGCATPFSFAEKTIRNCVASVSSNDDADGKGYWGSVSEWGDGLVGGKGSVSR
jgi:hypothetical protein